MSANLTGTIWSLKDSLNEVKASTLRLSNMTYPILHFREPFDDYVAWEVKLKGWYNGVTVEMENGSKYDVFFYDPTRLAQDLESETERSYVAEVAMIVIPEITEANMRAAIQRLYEERWFDGFQPISEASRL